MPARISFPEVPVHPDLFKILRGYASLVSPHHLQIPFHLEAQAIHDFFVLHILTSAHFKTYPPAVQYQKAFWKWTIPHLEKSIGEADPDLELEVDARVYNHYLGLLNFSGDPQAPGLTGERPPAESYITHFWRGDAEAHPDGLVDLNTYETTTLLEARTLVEGGTTGLRTWRAARVLAAHLVRNPALVQHTRILELGAGSGFLGCVVAALQLGSPRHKAASSTGALWLSDINDTVLARCRDNLRLTCNSSSAHPSTRCVFLDWAAALEPDPEPLASLLHDKIDADLILGADIVFDPYLIPALVGVLRLALQPRSHLRERSALIALTIRNPATMQQFIEAVLASGLILENLPPETKAAHDQVFGQPGEESGGDASSGVYIYRITSRPTSVATSAI
ncbi:hypothetical protein B0H15DRAFT_864379 [Mycena belliarum]|uniref:Uncharacterized protein n=1 Tax=Mycena belliarum TaxID=1033014 RepID=A0AAD6TW15_9AGAR|nr:hypothetical protein B0H15DRAFT_864379 [Mycena belliae]